MLLRSATGIDASKTAIRPVLALGGEKALASQGVSLRKVILNSTKRQPYLNFMYIRIVGNKCSAHETPKCQENVGCVAGVATIIR